MRLSLRSSPLATTDGSRFPPSAHLIPPDAITRRTSPRPAAALVLQAGEKLMMEWDETLPDAEIPGVAILPPPGADAGYLAMEPDEVGSQAMFQLALPFLLARLMPRLEY